MSLKNKLNNNLLIYPEFCLGGFPPKQFYTQYEAFKLIRSRHLDSNGVIISGYSETEGFNTYSSAIIVDGDNYYNSRKMEPWGRGEKSIYNPTNEVPSIFSTSIGNILTIICNDAFETRLGQVKKSEEIWGENVVDLLVIVSYWENGIEEFLVDRGIKRMAKGLNCGNWVLCDNFNGVLKSENFGYNIDSKEGVLIKKEN